MLNSYQETGCDKPSTKQATFNRASADTVNRAQAVCNQRGNEYLDSWHLSNLKTPYLDNLLRDWPIDRVYDDAKAAYKRLIVMASLIDVKISRLSGLYKEDTSLDLINYIGAYNTLRLEFEHQYNPKLKNAVEVCQGLGDRALNQSIVKTVNGQPVSHGALQRSPVLQ